MDLGLAGKKAIVTGGSKGIGRAIADTLAAQGCHVAICARTRTAWRAREGVAGKGVEAFGRALDVADRDALVGWVRRAHKNAASTSRSPTSARSTEPYRRSVDEFQVDPLYTVRTVDAAMPHLQRSDAGAIVAISSVSGLEHDFTSPAYGTFKAALIHDASRMASELAGKHIRVNAARPATPTSRAASGSTSSATCRTCSRRRWTNGGRMATDQEVANAAAFRAAGRPASPPA